MQEIDIVMICFLEEHAGHSYVGQILPKVGIREGFSLAVRLMIKY